MPLADHSTSECLCGFLHPHTLLCPCVGLSRCWLSLSFSCLTCRNVANGECVGRWGTDDDWERRRRRRRRWADRQMDSGKCVRRMNECVEDCQLHGHSGLNGAVCIESVCVRVYMWNFIRSREKVTFEIGGIKMFLLMVSSTYRKDAHVS